MNDLDRLIAAIPFGKENAVDRFVLSERMGLSDRKVRQLIEDARNAGLFIINNSDGRGYYQTTDLDEMVRNYRQVCKGFEAWPLGLLPFFSFWAARAFCESFTRVQGKAVGQPTLCRWAGNRRMKKWDILKMVSWETQIQASPRSRKCLA